MKFDSYHDKNLKKQYKKKKEKESIIDNDIQSLTTHINTNIIKDQSLKMKNRLVSTMATLLSRSSNQCHRQTIGR
jgi:hypothetical protein